MATIPEVLVRMRELGLDKDTSFQFIDLTLMQVNAKTKRNPAFLKIAVRDNVADNYLTHGHPKQTGILVMVDREAFFNTWETMEKGD